MKAIDIYHLRQGWIDSGANRKNPETKPEGWVLEDQLAKVPAAYQFKGL